MKLPKIGKRLSPIPLLLLISLRPKTLKKRHGGQRGNILAIKLNATEVVKKKKDKAKDLSHIKCYTCKQKSHYANKCLDKPKS